MCSRRTAFEFPRVVNKLENTRRAGFSNREFVFACLLGSQFHSLQRFPRSLLTAQPFPQVPDWPAFRAFSLSPFVSVSGLAGQVRAPVAATGGRFSPSPGRFAELVNGSARLSEPRPDVLNRLTSA